MKLTNYMRDAFVRQVMDDVPSVDYDEAIRNEVMKSAITALPQKVRAAWTDKTLRGYINVSYFSANGVSVADVPMPNGADCKAVKKHLEDAVAGLVSMRKAQTDQQVALRAKLKQCAYSVTTRKALTEILPEFERYLPADETSALRRSLPVIANVVADFVKAGWPKDHKRKVVAQ